MLALPGLDIVGLTDIDTNGSPQVDLIDAALLDRLVQVTASAPGRRLRALGPRWPARSRSPS